MRRPWTRRRAVPAPRLVIPVIEAMPMVEYPLEQVDVVVEATQPEPHPVLRQPERPMGYVDPLWISPVVRQFFPYSRWPRLSPYFEHTEYRIFVEARPYADVVERFADEVRPYERGQLWCMCYSTGCVKGEEGHHHMSVLRPISPERFRAAQAAGWDL
jgi:hypothetical protein